MNTSLKSCLFQTRVTEILDIEYPVIAGGMAWISNARLASAVSEAGGLGQIAAGSFPDGNSLRKEIREARRLTDRPFGVNIPLISPGAEWMIEVAIEEGIKVITTSAGNPHRFTKRIKSCGIRVLHVVPSVKLAKKAEDAGVDAIVAEGVEAGGHNGVGEITTLVLVPQVVDAVRIPVIAAGGIADARGFVAARALGAEGVQMGTRFVVSRESPAHPNFKRAIIEADEEGTVLTARSIGHPVRAIRNSFTEKVVKMEKEGRSEEEIFEFIGPSRTRLGMLLGDIQEGSLMAGQIAGMIKEEKTVKEIFRDIVEGAESVLRLLSLG